MSLSDVLIVLAHFMEADGTLDFESRARADKAAELFYLRQGCPIILVGWNYRDDSDLYISDAIASYLISVHHIKKEYLFIDRRSRDTVGDAIFSKKSFGHLIIGKTLGVITSHYHADRTRIIFEFVYEGFSKICVFGVEVPTYEETIAYELTSLQAFKKTFAGVEAGNDKSICKALIQYHPYYNGEVYSELGVEFLTS